MRDVRNGDSDSSLTAANKATEGNISSHAVFLWAQINQMFQIVTFTNKLTYPALCIYGSCIKTKMNFYFFFHSSLWCLKRFYEGL